MVSRIRMTTAHVFPIATNTTLIVMVWVTLAIPMLTMTVSEMKRITVRLSTTQTRRILTVIEFYFIFLKIIY